MRFALMAAPLAVGILVTGLIAGQAFALDPPAPGPNRLAPINVADDGLGVAGVDIGNAGTSRQSRLTYVNNLLQDTQATVWARCGEILTGEDASSDTVAFCKDVLATR